jgi:hypothetical protein
MNDCQCKSGFFSLRDCGQPAVGMCSECKRAMCQQHGSATSTYTQCRDCWARNDQDTDGAQYDGNKAYNDNWAYSYRHRYYGNGYSPVYTGSHYNHYYDRYDARSFNERSSDFDDGSDNARAGFGDS